MARQKVYQNIGYDVSITKVKRMSLPSANPTRNELYPNSPQDKNDLSNPINSPARLPATMAMTP